MIIYVCIGSSCHLKGSYDIIALFKESIKKNNLQEKVELTASFCLGQCGMGKGNGVSVKFDDILTCVRTDNFDEVFKMRVIDVLN